MIKELELGTDLVPAGVGPYSFISEFNRVQSTIIRSGLPTKDCNLVLGTATSTGKTISAELFVHAVLATGKKIVYVAPMKALVSEKKEEWSDRFGNKIVSILTGDFRSEANTADRLKDSNIVVMTTEMMDSQSRRAHKQSEHWMRDVGLIVMDEGHIIGSESRGVPGEMGITRTCGLNPDNPPRILILSATLPNVGEFADWLFNLNGKDTYMLNSSWRPVKLKWEFQPVIAKAYAQSRKEMVQKTISLAKSKPTEKFLCFVHEKKTGHNLVAGFEKAGINVEFHRADLSAKRRNEIETRFKDKTSDLRVIIATSTIAWGSLLTSTLVNVPAENSDNVIQIEIGDLKRGDKILSLNEESGLIEEDIVSHTVQYEANEYYEIELEDGTIIQADYKHPFYTDKGLLETKDLKEGMELYTYGTAKNRPIRP